MQNLGMSARRLATRSMAAALALVALLYARRSEAHFNLIMPPPADNATDGGKGAPPCGPTGASNVVTSVQGGHAIMLQLDETVLHPGWYRVALSINSRSELPADPMVTVSGGNSTNATYETTPVFPVLADHLFNHTSGTTPIHYSMSLTLPNVTCTKCTLQVIEFMNMHGSNPGGGYFYHHCADLKITADPAGVPIFQPPTPDGGAPDASGSGGAGGGAGGRGGQGGSGPGTGGRGGTTGSAGTTGAGGAAGNVGTTGSAGTSGGSGTTGSAEYRIGRLDRYHWRSRYDRRVGLHGNDRRSRRDRHLWLDGNDRRRGHDEHDRIGRHHRPDVRLGRQLQRRAGNPAPPAARSSLSRCWRGCSAGAAARADR